MRAHAVVLCDLREPILAAASPRSVRTLPWEDDRRSGCRSAGRGCRRRAGCRSGAPARPSTSWGAGPTSSCGSPGARPRRAGGRTARRRPSQSARGGSVGGGARPSRRRRRLAATISAGGKRRHCEPPSAVAARGGSRGGPGARPSRGAVDESEDRAHALVDEIDACKREQKTKDGVAPDEHEHSSGDEAQRPHDFQRGTAGLGRDPGARSAQRLSNVDRFE